MQGISPPALLRPAQDRLFGEGGAHAVSHRSYRAGTKVFGLCKALLWKEENHFPDTDANKVRLGPMLNNFGMPAGFDPFCTGASPAPAKESFADTKVVENLVEHILDESFTEDAADFLQRPVEVHGDQVFRQIIFQGGTHPVERGVRFRQGLAMPLPGDHQILATAPGLHYELMDGVDEGVQSLAGEGAQMDGIRFMRFF